MKLLKFGAKVLDNCLWSYEEFSMHYTPGMARNIIVQIMVKMRSLMLYGCRYSYLFETPLDHKMDFTIWILKQLNFQIAVCLLLLFSLNTSTLMGPLAFYSLLPNTKYIIFTATTEGKIIIWNWICIVLLSFYNRLFSQTIIFVQFSFRCLIIDYSSNNFVLHIFFTFGIELPVSLVL